jgi:hypothetical protein
MPSSSMPACRPPCTSTEAGGLGKTSVGRPSTGVWPSRPCGMDTPGGKTTSAGFGPSCARTGWAATCGIGALEITPDLPSNSDVLCCGDVMGGGGGCVLPGARGGAFGFVGGPPTRVSLSSGAGCARTVSAPETDSDVDGLWSSMGGVGGRMAVGAR